MKLLTYKGHPVINLEQVCSMRIEHSNLVNRKFLDHFIVFVFHDNVERWKMESEEEATFIHTEIISGILGGNAHIILEEPEGNI